MLLVDLAIRSSIVLLLGLGLRALLRRRSAALRHRVLATALFASASVAPLTLILPAWSMPAGRPPTAMVMAIETVRASPAAPIETRTLPSPGQWAALVWSAGLVAGVVTLALGIRRLKRIGARAHRVGDSKWTALVHRISRAYGLKRSVVLLQTNEPTVLATWGLRPSRVTLADRTPANGPTTVLTPCSATSWRTSSVQTGWCRSARKSSASCTGSTR